MVYLCYFIIIIIIITEYRVRVSACNAAACGVSQAVSDTTKCAAPSKRTISVADSRSSNVTKPGEENLIRLTWDAPTKIKCDTIAYAVEWTSDYRGTAPLSPTA